MIIEETVPTEQNHALKVIDTAIDSLKTGNNDAAHWEPAVIEAAKLLFNSDKAEFQRKRSELKKASKESQITEWTREVKGLGEQADGSKADELVDLIKESSELFHNSRGECFVTFSHSGHYETWMIGSTGFIDWLSLKAYSELGFSPGEATIKQAITALNGIAKYDGVEREVYLRCAPCDSGYIIDLCNEQWQAIKVTPTGWQVINNPEIKFIRSSTATALPMPSINKGNLDLIWNHLNIPEQQRPLVLAYLLESWRPDTPFVLLLLIGQQGCAKSSTHTVLRQLSDPNSVPLRTAPKTVQDIYVAAANNWQAAFENISNLTDSMQDALCTICTGGGYAGRKLYSDADESIIEVKRPVLINSIASVVPRPDLIDRTIAMTLPLIKDENRKRDAQLAKEFIKDAPAIFTGLLDLFVDTLRELPSIHIEKPPRMIDFSYLGEAMLKALGKEGFTDLYKGNRKASLAYSLDSSPAALAVQEMMFIKKVGWTGTFKQLKKLLDDHYHQDGEGWPKSPKGLSDILRRMAPALREHGVNVEFLGHDREGSKVHISFTDLSESENNHHHRHTVTESGKYDGNDQKCDGVTHVMVNSAFQKKPNQDIPANCDNCKHLNPCSDKRNKTGICGNQFSFEEKTGVVAI